MDKKQNDKMLEIIRAMQANGGMMEDPSMPEHIKELIRNAQDSGANVLAVSAEQYAAMGGDVTDLLENSMMLSVSANRDTKDPRYALSNQFAKELASREMELMQIMKGKGAPAHDVIRLQALMFGNVDDIMDIAKEKMKRDGDGKSEIAVLTTLAMMKTIGITNVFDALKSGQARLRWHGVPSRALNFITQFGDNISVAISKRLELPLSAVRIITNEMATPTPLAPLPPEKVFNPDLNGVFMRSLFPEANAGLDAVVAAGFTSLGEVFAKSNGLTELEEKFGVSKENVTLFAMILERIDDVSIEAIDSVVEMIPDDPDQEEERLRQAEIQPVITLDDPVTIAALGTNLITTLEIAGVVDLHELTGLRPTEAGEAIRKELNEEARRSIRDLARFKNQDCGCESCEQFKKAYVEMNPAIKLALRTPAHKPTLH